VVQYRFHILSPILLPQNYSNCDLHYLTHESFYISNRICSFLNKYTSKNGYRSDQVIPDKKKEQIGLTEFDRSFLSSDEMLSFATAANKGRHELESSLYIDADTTTSFPLSEV
jgi:hypothetical protein